MVIFESNISARWVRACGTCTAAADPCPPHFVLAATIMAPRLIATDAVRVSSNLAHNRRASCAVQEHEEEFHLR